MSGSHAGDSARGVGDVGARDGETGGDAEYAGDVVDETEVAVLVGDADAEDRRGGVL